MPLLGDTSIRLWHIGESHYGWEDAINQKVNTAAGALITVTAALSGDISALATVVGSALILGNKTTANGKVEGALDAYIGFVNQYIDQQGITIETRQADVYYPATGRIPEMSGFAFST